MIPLVVKGPTLFVRTTPLHSTIVVSSFDPPPPDRDNLSTRALILWLSLYVTCNHSGGPIFLEVPDLHCPLFGQTGECYGFGIAVGLVSPEK